MDIWVNTSDVHVQLGTDEQLVIDFAHTPVRSRGIEGTTEGKQQW